MNENYDQLASRICLVSILAVGDGCADLCAQAPTPCTLGSWGPVYDHGGSPVQPPACANPPVGLPSGPFDASHAALIPKGPHQGHVLVFDHFDYSASDPVTSTRVIRYSIINFSTQPPTFHNHVVCLTPNQGDLFCAGLAWNANGDLVLAGGTMKHGYPFGGAKLLYVWTPPTSIGAPGTWTPNAVLLDDHRWYPSLLMLGPDPNNDEDPILVLGGSDLANGGVVHDTYQCWRPSGGPAGSWQSNTVNNTFAGPGVSGNPLGDYPRAHFLTTKEAATAGMLQITAKANHFVPPRTWTPFAMRASRLYGSSLLFPILPGGAGADITVAIGGKSASGNILSTFEWCVASSPSPVWVSPPNPPPPGQGLAQPRWFLNTILLPDSTMLAIGGEQQWGGFGCSQVPALVPEIFSGSQRVPMLAGTIIRDYHSTALLLDDARAFTGGGESRRFGPRNCANPPTTPTVAPADYQLFVPPYINCGHIRPDMGHVQGTHQVWDYGTSPFVSYGALPLGLTISKVTLLRAGAVTHHADPNQRCVELPFTNLPDTDPPSPTRALQVTVPTKLSYLLPRGYYMLYLVTNQGTPSKAAWVKIQ